MFKKVLIAKPGVPCLQDSERTYAAWTWVRSSLTPRVT